MPDRVNRYRMLLVEQLVEEDSAEFVVEAASPGLAAAILHEAHGLARDQDTNMVSLPDGQWHNIEPTDIVRSRVFCILLDADGNEIGEVEPDFGSAPPPEAA